MTARSTRQTTFFIAAALLALAGLAAPLRAATVGQVWYTIGQGGSPNTGLFRVGVDGSNPVLQQSGSSPTAVIFPYGVAVDPVQGKFFYAENYDYFTSEQIRSGSMATTNSSLTTIYNTPNPNAEVLGGLRVDTTSHNLYFALADYAAATNNGVYRLAETGGSATKVGGTGGVALQSPLNLALDLPDNLVFLTDVYNGTVNNLDVCNLSTGNAVSLYSLPTLSSLLFGVDVDPVNHFLYLAVSPQATGAGNEILKFSFTVTGSGTTAAVGSLTGPTTLYNSTSAGEPFDVVADLLVGTLYLADNNLPGVTHGTVLGTGSVSALHTVAGEVSAQNVFLEAAPVLTTSGSTVSYSGGGAAVVVDASASVTDSTSTELSWVAVTMTSGYNTGDILSANPAGTVITDSYNSSTGALTLAGPDTLAHFKQVLDTVSYSSTNINANNSGFNPTRTLGFAASDGFITVGGSASDSVTIPDTPPTLTAGGTAQYNAAGGPVVADSSLVVTDPDNTTLASATVSISSGFLSGDKLLFTNQNGITGSYNTITGRLGLSGTSSVANYQTALQSISYTSSASDPSKGGTDNTRILSWTANDGTLDSTAVTSTVDITVFTPTPTATASLTPSATASTRLPTAPVLPLPIRRPKHPPPRPLVRPL